MGNYCPNYLHVEGKDSRSDWADRKTHNCLFCHAVAHLVKIPKLF